MMQQARQASATAQPQPETSERETQAAAGTAETATAVQAKSSAASTCNFASPLTGTAVAMADIPDPIFATGVIGPGAAISPDSDILLCPCTATVISNFELPHSVGLRLENGAEILIHAGINTVRLQGRGFSAPLPEGTVLQPGDEIMHFDRRLIESEGLNPMVIFAVTTPEFDGIMLAGPGSRVSPGEPFLSVCRKQA